jgi:hypothetical protein
MKLHLGCGQHLLAGYVNVDKEGTPDQQWDLEVRPWPWEDNCAEEILLVHTLEHLGPTPEAFIGIVKELYRICAPGALVRIVVPHPRHDHFLGDPTHVRVITPEVLSLFSKRNCELWKATGASNTPLALYHGVDFEIIKKEIVFEERYKEALDLGTITALELDRYLSERNNIATEMRFVWRAVKPWAPS